MTTKENHLHYRSLCYTHYFPENGCAQLVQIINGQVVTPEVDTKGKKFYPLMTEKDVRPSTNYTEIPCTH